VTNEIYVKMSIKKTSNYYRLWFYCLFTNQL